MLGLSPYAPTISAKYASRVSAYAFLAYPCCSRTSNGSDIRMFQRAKLRGSIPAVIPQAQITINELHRPACRPPSSFSPKNAFMSSAIISFYMSDTNSSGAALGSRMPNSVAIAYLVRPEKCLALSATFGIYRVNRARSWGKTCAIPGSAPCSSAFVSGTINPKTSTTSIILIQSLSDSFWGSSGFN